MVVAPPDGFASPRPKLSSFVPDISAQMWFEGECFRLFLNDCHSQISMQCQAVISSSKLFSLMWISAFVGPNWIPPPSLYVVLMCFLFFRCFLYIFLCVPCVLCNWIGPNAFYIKTVCTTMSFSFPCRLGNKLVELQAGRKIWTSRNFSQEGLCWMSPHYAAFSGKYA